MATSTSPDVRLPRWVAWTQVVLFLAVIFAPAVDHCLRSDDDRGPGPELRRQAPRPQRPRSLTELLAFPAGYEAYWRDTFGLRDVLLRWHSALKVLLFGVAPDVSHVIGEHGWIFNDNNSLIDNWRGVIPLRKEELQAWQDRLERRRAAVASVGAHHLFAIAPDKPQIYPQYVPKQLNKVAPARMDQLSEWLRAHSQVDWFDVRPALVAERANDRPGDYVYFPLGTHWEMRGAIATYNAIADHLHPVLPGLRRYSIEDF